MDPTVYICTGTCQAEISEEQYKKGLTKCGAEGCTHHGHPFETRKKCRKCGETYREGTKHTCSS